MTTMLHNIAAGAADFARNTNTYMQDVQYVGRVWSGVRDYAVFPAAGLVRTYVCPFFSTIANFVVANAKPLTIGGVVILLAAAGAHYYFRAPTDAEITELQAILDKASKACTDQETEIKKLTDAAEQAAAALQKANMLTDDVADRADQIAQATDADNKAKADLKTAQDAMQKLDADFAAANKNHNAAMKARRDAENAKKKP